MTRSTEKIAAHLHKIIPEFSEGYFLLGKNPLNGEIFARFWAPNYENAEEMNMLLTAVVRSGGIKIPHEG